MKKTPPNTEPGIFADAVATVDRDSPLYKELYALFNREMEKAVKRGRICTPERMALLYPIFREINAEQDEMSAELLNYTRRRLRHGK